MKSLSGSEYRELISLYESIYAPKFESILDEFTDEDLLDLTDEYIEQQVEEFFLECLEEGLDIIIVEETICESIDQSLELLSEAKVTVGHDTERVSRRKEALKRVKSAAKKVGKGIQGSLGVAARAAGTAARAGSRVKGAISKGYQRGRYGSDGSEPSSDSESSSSGSTSSRERETTSSTPARRKDSLLKRGLKKLVRGAGKTISTGLGAAKAASDYVVSRAAKR